MDSVINLPKISVLMPVYNCELYIQEAIESILIQTFSDFEFLIIDDASTDSTLEVIKKYNDPRIKLIEKPNNTGYTNSLNYGLSIARGTYIARMDGDDISLPKRFEKQFSFMESNPDVAVCGTSFKILGTDDSVFLPEKHDAIKTGMLKECKIAHPSVMMRVSFFKQNKISYDTFYEPAEDYDLWVRVSRIGKLNNLQEILLLYRFHDDQVSNTNRKKQNLNATLIKTNLLTYLDRNISENEIKVYKTMLQSINTVSFSDFKVFLKLKKRITSLNNNEFFNENLLRKHFFEIEKKYVSLNYKNNNSYDFAIYFQYLKIFNSIYARLSWKQSTKLFFKCILFHKVK